ncbi:UNVERIFIED_CONTAM: hypothetical protein Slati_2642900 [Sesamum latifolium]|uniref:Uncharacterized protein n=1 Tax=Sesamum latifolium TaxID=2727402 RepID=A0AAW2VW06_9LAMI
MLAWQVNKRCPSSSSSLAPSTNRIVRRDFEAVAAARNDTAIAICIAVAATTAFLKHGHRAVLVQDKFRIV